LRRADADVRRDADRSGLAGCSGLVLDRRVDAFGLRCCFLRCQRHPPEPQHVPQSSVTAHELKSAERHGAGSRRSRGDDRPVDVQIARRRIETGRASKFASI